MTRWKKRLSASYSAMVSVKDFLSKYMDEGKPSLHTITKMKNHADSQLKQTTKDIKNTKVEKGMYNAFVTYLQKSVEVFPSSSTKPTFEKTWTTTFERLHPTDHDSRPDVSGSRPGCAAPPKWAWPHVGTVFEFKFKDDPFDPSGNIKPGQLANLVQLIKSARCILMASGSCFAFVVSVFGTHARLFRVDRTAYIVTDSFSWVSDPKVFPEFILRLYNGGKGNGLLGDDATISEPSAKEKLAMHAALLKIEQYATMPLEYATANSRWVDVEIEGKARRCFTVGPPIFQSKGLFCRGTRVDRALIEGENPPKLFALKDAWRQACRHPESHFYAVIQDYVAKTYENEQPIGLAACVGSVDLSKKSPDHRTFTATLRNEEEALLDRCHDRTVLDRVGFPLEEFQTTKQLVQAVRDAISGHQIAFLAGVLHRDVSAGNVLIDEKTHRGFLHDWDYSQLTPAGLIRFTELFGAPIEKIDKSLKDITGTYPFLAIDVLKHSQAQIPEHRHEVKHDLESFYYLLIWIALRHTDHQHPDREKACSFLFDDPQESKAISLKEHWLSVHKNRLLVANNRPLSTLIDDLTVTFFHQTDHTFSTKTDATYEAVLAHFDKALASEEWPQLDPARPFVLPKTEEELGEQDAQAPLPFSSASASKEGWVWMGSMGARDDVNSGGPGSSKKRKRAHEQESESLPVAEDGDPSGEEDDLPRRRASRRLRKREPESE
ncbi:hypothetical protein FB451DRAFT_239568 [Mycena latifolia]|nr:hypothetical protein FB451DRAFT_239568 [Mycena latifolia]